MTPGAERTRRPGAVDLGGGWWCWEDRGEGHGPYEWEPSLGWVLVDPEGDESMWFNSVAECRAEVATVGSVDG